METMLLVLLPLESTDRILQKNLQLMTKLMNAFQS